MPGNNMQPYRAGGPCEWINARLAEIKAQSLFRQTRPRPAHALAAPARKFLDFATNDYLAMSQAPEVRSAAAEAVAKFGPGASASRLLSGTFACHEQLESALADFKGYPAALVFGSGYLANVGAISALAGPGDFIAADRLSHASIIDGILLSRAAFKRFRHNDAGHLAALLAASGGGRKLVITESVFSMGGDIAPLLDIAETAEKYGAMLMVDEAHAFGVFGPAGAGLVSAAALQERVHVCMGTLSKAAASYGGFVACSREMRDWLVNEARPFIFSTALPPPCVAAALKAVELFRAHPDMGTTLLARAEKFRRSLAGAGMDTGRSSSQIVPVVVGGNQAALELSERLARAGIWAPAIRPPTVPKGRAQLRFSVTLAHSETDLEFAARAIIEASRESASPA